MHKTPGRRTTIGVDINNEKVALPTNCDDKKTTGDAREREREKTYQSSAYTTGNCAIGKF